MRKHLFLFLISIFIFVSCNVNPADDVDSFPAVDYSSLIKDDCYKIDPSIDALTVLNLCYNVYGYGNFDITGIASHTETAVLNGVQHSETITRNINKVKIYHNTDSNNTISTFYVDFICDNNEVFSYCYKWQYHNTNAWNNNKIAWDITISK